MSALSQIQSRGEVYMILKDRKHLAKLMVIQDVSARQLAKSAGWRSHSYMNRLLAGQVKTLAPDPALRIANRLGVGVDDLFVVRVSDESGRIVRAGGGWHDCQEEVDRSAYAAKAARL